MYHQVALIRSYKLHNTTDNSPKSPKGNFEEFCSGRTKPKNNLKCFSKTHKPFVLNFVKILQYIKPPSTVCSGSGDRWGYPKSSKRLKIGVWLDIIVEAEKLMRCNCKEMLENLDTVPFYWPTKNENKLKHLAYFF
mgnify:CR=1 FL=1